MMLDHLGQRDKGDRIRSCFEHQVREGTQLTRDLGGTAGTDAFTDELVARIRG
jgi:isocitrate dehydrogenase (NAD+)